MTVILRFPAGWPAGRPADACGAASPLEDQIKLFSAWNYCTRGKDLQQKEFWTCTFCATSFKDWNVSKALAHIAKVSGYSIKPCPSNSMTIEETELFTAVVAYKAAVLTKKRSQQAMRDETSEGLIAAATSLVSKKSRGSEPVFGTTSGLVQQSLPALLMLQDDELLTMHIGNFFLTNGLDFSLVDKPSFKSMIKAAAKQSTGFITPGRKKVANELLDAQYLVYQHEQLIQANAQSESLTDMNTQWSLESSEFDVDIGLTTFGVQVIAPEIKRIFKAFGEQWEADANKSNTEMGEFPLAEKYAGIKFFDSVTNEHFIILAERCQWIKRYGWHVRAQLINDDAAISEEPEAYAMNQALWDMIIASAHLNLTRTICSEEPEQ